MNSIGFVVFMFAIVVAATILAAVLDDQKDNNMSSNNEIRMLQLELLLEDLLECFNPEDTGYSIENNEGGFTIVSDDVADIVEKANYVLFEDPKEDEFDYLDDEESID